MNKKATLLRYNYIIHSIIYRIFNRVYLRCNISTQGMFYKKKKTVFEKSWATAKTSDRPPQIRQHLEQVVRIVYSDREIMIVNGVIMI